MTGYVFGKVRSGSKACRLDSLQNVPDDFELLRGVPRAAGFPADASFRMSDKFPRALQLEDFLRNPNGLLVVSARVRDLVQAHGAPDNELLPVTVVNHKGRVEKAPYFILHQTGLVDCLDTARCVATPNPIDPQLFITVQSLAIDDQRVPPDATLFRMARYPFAPVFRRDLADRIMKEGFSGITMVEIADWKD